MTTTTTNFNSFLYSKVFIVIAVVFSILVTVFVYFELRDEEQHGYNLRLDKTINVYSSVFSLKIKSYIQELDDIKRFYDSSQYVDYANFVSFVSPRFNDELEIQALEWAPKITHEQLRDHETRYQVNNEQYFIWQQDSDKNKIKVAQQNFYYPVTYVYPRKGNDSAIGFNLASETIRNQALMTAQDSGLPVATESILLVQDTRSYNNSTAFLIFTPYYRLDTKPVTAAQIAAWTVAQRQENITGFILGVFKVSTMFEAAIQYLPSSGLDILVVDVTERDDYELLYTHWSRLSTAEDSEHTRNFHDDNLIKREFRLAGREWQLVFYPTVHYFNEFKHNNAIILFGVGLFMSLLLLVYLLTLRYRMLLINNQNEKYNTQLLNSEIRQRAVIETIADALIVINKTGVIESFNPAAVKLFGYEVEEVIGENIKMLMPSEIKSQHDGYLSHFIETGDKHVIGVGREVVGLNKNGTTFPLILSVKEMLLQGELKFTGVMRDISKQKDFENELILAKELAEAGMKSKHDFLATMSHEIRTPMNGVLGMIQILRDTELSNEQCEYVDVINNSGQALLGIINDILDFSKMDAGQLKIDHIKFDLEQSILNVIQLFSQKALDKNIQIIFNYSLECPKFVMGDPNRIRQVVMNLVGNALKFTEQGHIYVLVEQLQKVASHCTLKIMVQDTGIGIPEKAIATLFDSFTQADSSTTRDYGGTGLGLAICKQLVQLMSGEIGISSTLDIGSQFWFSLVLEQQDDGNSAEPEIIDALKIIIVDDYEFSRSQLETQLSGLGATVSAVDCCEKALSKLVDNTTGGASCDPFDILIVNYSLNNNETLETIHNIRANQKLVNLGIILLNSELGVGDTNKYLAAGVNAYFTKPVLNSVLYQAITTVLTQKQQVQLVTLQTLGGGIEKKINTTHYSQVLVLIVEDNEVNTLVIKAMLERLGIESVTASDGRDAITSWSNSRFDLILMDCQMPILDGYGATKEIRKIEQQQGAKAIPIIALTANVMQGDKEKCLAAGMDDFLAKPIESSRLETMLSNWLDNNKHSDIAMTLADDKDDQKDPPVAQIVSGGAKPESIIDMKTIQQLNELMGDALAELINSYINLSAQTLDSLQQAMEAADSNEILQLAHRLKGSSGNVGAVTVMRLSGKIEQLAKVEQLDGVAQMIDELLLVFAEAKKELQSVVAK